MKDKRNGGLRAAVLDSAGGRRHDGGQPMKRGAVLFRLAHAAVAVVELWALGWVWGCALMRRRGRALSVAVGVLVAEGIALVIGRGDCPLGPMQRRLGDPIPLFELVLPPRAAKAAIPALFGVAIAGLAGLVLRPPANPTARVTMKFTRRTRSFPRDVSAGRSDSGHE